MPAETPKQRRFLCADYARAKEGKRTRTGMSLEQLHDFCSSTPKKRQPNALLARRKR